MYRGENRAEVDELVLFGRNLAGYFFILGFSDERSDNLTKYLDCTRVSTPLCQSQGMRVQRLNIWILPGDYLFFLVLMKLGAKVISQSDHATLPHRHAAVTDLTYH